MQQFSALSNLPPTILEQFNQVAENTKNHLLSHPLPPKIKLPSIEALQERKWPLDFVCIGRGPSFFKNDYIGKLKQARDMGHRFAVVACDGVVGHCLDKELVPDLVATVDPSIRILKWWGDVQHVTDEDEYFAKDRDSPKNGKALLSTERTITLLDEQGAKLSVAMTPLSHELVLDRVMSIGADVFLFLPMSDDQQLMDKLWEAYPKLIAVNAAGQVGGACYSIAQFLGGKRIALVGYDMGYPPDTPLEQTQYFDLIQANPELAEKMFFKVENPHLTEPWFTDVVYLGYAYALRRMAERAAEKGVKTVNCTGGGILSGEGIEWSTLTEYLKDTIRAM